MMMTRRTALGFSVAMISPQLIAAATRGHDVKYVGGTLSEIREDTDGQLYIDDDKVLRWVSKKSSFSIPYDSITSVEFGQKSGRRIAVAVLVTPLALLSKKRRHFLTVGYKDSSDKTQGVVLELAKGLPRSVITVIESRSGVKCEYESEEAKKHVHG